MKKIGFLLVFLGCFFSCDDGDIFVTELTFDDVSALYCEGSSSLIFYKIKTDPYQTVSFSTDLLNTSILNTPGDATSSISATSPFYFRQYNGDPTALFCSDFPPSSPNVTNEFIMERNNVG